MPRVKKKLVREKLAEWEQLQAKLAEAEKKKNDALAPLLKVHNEHAKPILEKFDKTVAPLNEQNTALTNEILSLIQADTDEKGRPKPVIIEEGNATAKVSHTDGPRVVNPEKFFDFVQQKNKKFWDCVTVGVALGEELIGKEDLNPLCTKDTKIKAEITLKK